MNEETKQIVEVVDRKTGELTTEAMPTPQELLLMARDAARALENVIKCNERPPIMFNGKRHLEYPHWQTVGKFYHASVKTGESEFVEIAGVQGFRAKAEVIDENTGMIVGGAWAYCMRDEANWKAKPLFQLASMAQTRAGAKALSNKFRYVAIVAGFEPTPAEEMPEEMRGAGKQVAMPKQKTVQPESQSAVVVPEPAPPVTVEPAKKEIEFGEAPPEMPNSKFLEKLHIMCREKNIPNEVMKVVIKTSYGKDTSKDLTDAECISLIKSIERGLIKYEK